MLKSSVKRNRAHIVKTTLFTETILNGHSWQSSEEITFSSLLLQKGHVAQGTEVVLGTVFCFVVFPSAAISAAL